MVRADLTQPPVLAVVGPTGVGKTSFGLRLAERFGGEIVNVDSVQLYRFVDIGSAKPTPEEQQRVPHHLVDILPPDEPYTAADFRRDALRAIADIDGRGLVPVVVGGTALYVRALLQGICEAPAADPAFREELVRRAAESGWPALHEELARVDPRAAERIHPNDRVRIERALEVLAVSGRPFSDIQQQHGFAEPSPRALRIGLDIPRELLYERIDRRVLQMLESGWVEEVESLLAQGYDPGLKPLQAIGYRDVVRWVRGELDREEAVRLIQRDTRRFSRRQLTWFRKEPGTVWCDPRDGLTEDLEDRIRRFLRNPEEP